MGSMLSKSRHRDSSPLSKARKQLAYQDAPRLLPPPKPPKEPPPIRILEWPIRESKSCEDPWLPGWYGPRLPEWLLWVPEEVARPPDHPEPRLTTRTAYIRCLEKRAMKWHEWAYPHRREYDLRYGLDRAEEAEMVARLNDTAYAQRELLGDDWAKYETIPTEPLRPQGPPVDGSVPPSLSFLRPKRRPPYWLFYPAGPEAYQIYPNVEPEQVWVSILRKRADKWSRWRYPGRHEFRKRFERYEPDGHGGRPDAHDRNSAPVLDAPEDHDEGTASAAAQTATDPPSADPGSPDDKSVLEEARDTGAEDKTA
ncbi:hypothetical protein NLU13_1425 [Sarocladium strictum]|uniref:Uncharacterized protein n=1 Tax=Sarocladium strictum TaxID=5046 RepID=A0AA39GQY7_SARSR|nr:hypothetical protein NLU13_1425 [Sarocladium strictum]